MLRRVSQLQLLPDAKIAVIASALQEVQLPPGAPLLRQGEEWDGLYFVCSGGLECGNDARLLTPVLRCLNVSLRCLLQVPLELLRCLFEARVFELLHLFLLVLLLL